LYLFRYRAIDYHPAPWQPGEWTLTYVQYILCFLGAPLISYDVTGAAAVGLIGLGLLSALCLRLLKRHKACIENLTPYLSMALFAVAAAAMTGLGRVAFGPDQAASSRYVSIANLLWIAIACLTWWVAELDGPCWIQKAPRAVFLSLLGLVLLLITGNAVYGSLRWSERYYYLLPARAALISGQDPGLLQRLHPEPRILLERTEILKRYRLTVFRD
jgi:hypothetical protein